MGVITFSFLLLLRIVCIKTSGDVFPIPYGGIVEYKGRFPYWRAVNCQIPSFPYWKTVDC